VPRVKPPALPGPHIVRDKIWALRERMRVLTYEQLPAHHSEWRTLHIDSVRALVDALNIYLTVSKEIAAALRADKRLSDTLSLLAAELVRETSALRELIREIDVVRGQGRLN
jgi:hypothetical protein